MAVRTELRRAHFLQLKLKSESIGYMAGVRTRGFCLTIWPKHRGDLTEDQVLNRFDKIGAQYAIGQKETGTRASKQGEGEHIQGYIYFKNARTLNGVKATLKKAGFRASIYCQSADATNKQASDYCKKEDTRREKYVEYGELPMDNGVKRGLTEATAAIKERGLKYAALEYPEEFIKYSTGMLRYAHIIQGENIDEEREVTVYYHWGDSGAGKSVYCRKFDPENYYRTQDMKEKIWFGDYQGQRTLIIDEFEGHCLASYMKVILEGGPIEVQTKGGFVWGQWTTVLITSNFDPATIYTSRENPWSRHPTQPIGPFQRRFETGGIYEWTGDYKKGTSKVDKILPIRIEQVDELNRIIEQEIAVGTVDGDEPEEEYEPMRDIGPPVSPMTPGTYIDLETMVNDLFDQE